MLLYRRIKVGIVRYVSVQDLLRVLGSEFTVLGSIVSLQQTASRCTDRVEFATATNGCGVDVCRCRSARCWRSSSCPPARCWPTCHTSRTTTATCRTTTACTPPTWRSPSTRCSPYLHYRWDTDGIDDCMYKVMATAKAKVIDHKMRGQGKSSFSSMPKQRSTQF